MTTQRVVLCEGYTDRAFWRGLLLHLGYADPGATGGVRTPVYDPWGRRVAAGQYGFVRPSCAFTRVVPVGGFERMRPAIREYLRDANHPVETLLVSVDGDVEDWDEARSRRRTSIRRAAEAVLGKLGDAEHSAWRSGDTIVAPVVLGYPGESATGVPAQQELERLVSAAIAEVYPERAEGVSAWLAASPPPRGKPSKNHAMSYLRAEGPHQGPVDRPRVGGGLRGDQLEERGGVVHLEAELAPGELLGEDPPDGLVPIPRPRGRGRGG